MNSVALSGSDVATINGRILADVADGNWAMLRFPNKLTNVKIGKNGNAIYGFNETGKYCEAEYRILRGTADDKFFLGLLNNYKSNPAGFVLLTGEFVKQIGDGAGNVSGDTYVQSGGAFLQEIDAEANAEGDTNQNVAIYKIGFSNSPRTIT